MDYEAFRQYYEKTHTASVPVLEKEGLPYPIWLKGATLVMFLAAALLSAVHTIPVVYATIPTSPVIAPEVRIAAANSSIIAFELGILLSAFLMASRSSMALAWVLLGIMFTGTVVANVYSISQVSEAHIGAGIVTLIFGAGIPIIALAAGKLFVNIYTAEFNADKRANATYREALKQWDAVVLRAWSGYRKEVEKRRGEPVKNVNFNDVKRNKPGKKLSQAVKWLNEHPEHLDTESRELAETIGVSHVTIWKAQQQIKQSENGHI